MNDLQIIDYIATYLKIDTKNPLTLQDLAEIENKKKFRRFMKANINHYNLKYISKDRPLERLEMLKKLYLEEINKDRLDKAQDEAYKLEQKFKEIVPTLDKHPTVELSSIIRQDNKEQYFTNFEISTFAKIGKTNYLLRCYKCRELQEKINEAFRKQILQVPRVKQLTNSKQADKQITNAVKRF